MDIGANLTGWLTPNREVRHFHCDAYTTRLNGAMIDSQPLLAITVIAACGGPYRHRWERLQVG